ncbi:hypothetical protein DNTS_003981 [Danionella cerebrum]|uniref:Uncharacterized protein n=1 Tax=Danionella cerebrum TaxID=2873325 RepID=A0A553PZ92_9TELE|nr:hypothetical protein DNTS_003981 [Danionella translucida]
MFGLKAPVYFMPGQWRALLKFSISRSAPRVRSTLHPPGVSGVRGCVFGAEEHVSPCPLTEAPRSELMHYSWSSIKGGAVGAHDY